MQAEYVIFRFDRGGKRTYWCEDKKWRRDITHAFTTGNLRLAMAVSENRPGSMVAKRGEKHDRGEHHPGDDR